MPTVHAATSLLRAFGDLLSIVPHDPDEPCSLISLDEGYVHLRLLLVRRDRGHDPEHTAEAAALLWRLHLAYTELCGPIGLRAGVCYLHAATLGCATRHLMGQGDPDDGGRA